MDNISDSIKLVEADFLVNMDEVNYSDSRIDSELSHIFKTNMTGKIISRQ